jgi:RNA polymerase subunit RPABC4/transcription elongation factor Spt4
MESFSFEGGEEDEHYVRKKAKSLSKYKVCEGCEQLLFDHMYVCPFCKAYRFTKDRARVSVAYDYFRSHYEEMVDQELDQF